VARQYAVTDEVFVSDDLSITGGAGGSRDISTSSASLRSAPSPQGEGLGCGASPAVRNQEKMHHQSRAIKAAA